VVDVLTEDDRLGEAIGLLQEVADEPGDERRPLLQDEGAVEVPLVVDPVVDDVPVLVELPLLRPPPR